MPYLGRRYKLHTTETWKKNSIHPTLMFFKAYHPYRRLKKAFNGSQEHDSALIPLIGQ